MIRATGATEAGKPVLFLGLSGENVTRLTAGEPILFDLAEFGWPSCGVVIAYGQTEHDIVADLRAHGIRTGWAKKAGE